MKKVMRHQELETLEFVHLGAQWYERKKNSIRIRVWGDEMDFYDWKSDMDNDKWFRGRIQTIEEVKWVLDHCFGLTW